MSKPPCNIVASTTALLLSAACVGAWLLGWIADGSTMAIRAGLLLGSLAVGAFSLLLVIRSVQRQQADAQKILERLCRTDAAELSAAVDSSGLWDVTPVGARWRDTLALVARTMAEAATRLTESEHLRATLEIRSHQSASRSKHMSTILAGLPDAVMVVDPYGDLLLANPSAQTLFGCDLSEPRSLTSVVDSPKLAALLDDLKRRRTATTRTVEIELTTADKTPRWYRVMVSGIAGEDESSQGNSSTEGAVIVFRDVSGQMEAQRRNAEFVSAVSHEMKTPLAGIKAYVELLADGDAEDEATREEFLGVINSQTNRLQRLIDNLLNLARIEAGVMQVGKKNQPLNEILTEAVNVVRPSAEAKRIDLVEDLSPLYLSVLVDRDLMLQTAINLLSNAIKYTPNGGAVTIRSRMVDTEVAFCVEDSGVGLGEEDCRRIFDKFYRVEKDKGMATGTGLGLPLAKHIAEDVHGGHLTVASEPGVGSAFTVTLPCAGQLC